MPVFIYLKSKKKSEVYTYRNLLIDLQNLVKKFDFFNERTEMSQELIQQINDFALSILVDISDGQEVLEDKAWEIIKNFEGNPALPFRTKKEITDFINLIETKFPHSSIPVGQSLGVRFYIGKPDASPKSKYNIIAVPVCGPDRDVSTNRRRHDLDKEKTFFTDNKVDFFAFDITSGNTIKFDEAKKLIPIKDTSVINPDPAKKAATQIVYFSLSELKRFIDLSERDTVRFYFGRIAPKDCLTLVIESERSVLVYFDQGDLIPPPPSDQNKPIDDTFF